MRRGTPFPDALTEWLHKNNFLRKMKNIWLLSAFFNMIFFFHQFVGGASNAQAECREFPSSVLPSAITAAWQSWSFLIRRSHLQRVQTYPGTMTAPLRCPIDCSVATGWFLSTRSISASTPLSCNTGLPTVHWVSFCLGASVPACLLRPPFVGGVSLCSSVLSANYVCRWEFALRPIPPYFSAALAHLQQPQLTCNHVGDCLRWQSIFLYLNKIE